MGSSAQPQGYIRLGDIADIQLTPGPAMIASENGQLRSVVFLNVRGRDMGSFVQEARDVLAQCAMLGDRTQLTRAPWPVLHVENRNSVAYRLMLVADGNADASVSLSAKRDWDLAAAYESMARASAVAGDPGAAADWKAKAAAALEAIADPAEREVIEGDIATLPV